MSKRYDTVKTRLFNIRDVEIAIYETPSTMIDIITFYMAV